ncbi:MULTISPECIES: DUF5829 family protein [unclassified Kitasatospora]|uniref:DUF5829 family protein n=1 Tax=unclassified Kitasatospora TaxID=2633591 RepID=UPI003811B833
MTGGSASGAERPVPRIDHVMVLVGEDVLTAVDSNSFVEGRFGRVKRKVADSSVAGSYSTLGVAGRNTLVELFGSPMPSASPLTGGLVFSFEEPGSSPVAHRLLDEAGLRHQHQLVTRADPGSGEQQPWYHLINADLGEGSRILLFLNEVTPEYFESLGAVPRPDGAMRRADYLDASLGTAEDGRLLRDLTGVTLETGPERAERLAAVLGALGFERTAAADGAIRLSGEDFELVLNAGEGTTDRIAEIRLSVAETAPGELPESVDFDGKSRILFEPRGAARWIFDPAS